MLRIVIPHRVRVLILPDSTEAAEEIKPLPFQGAVLPCRRETGSQYFCACADRQQDAARSIQRISNNSW
jgi:hypothetical protein